eukprot:scaffold1562_cov81-Phaeocystis_antarctica.AAC.2
MASSPPLPAAVAAPRRTARCRSPRYRRNLAPPAGFRASEVAVVAVVAVEASRVTGAHTTDRRRRQHRRSPLPQQPRDAPQCAPALEASQVVVECVTQSAVI